ncbi:13150_t:CDS:2, partial [Racocetra fulgida]
DTETESINSSNSKSGCPPTGVWKWFERGASKGDGHWEGTFNHLEDTPTDEPLYGMPNTTSSLIKEKKVDKQLTNWFDSVRLEKSKQSIIDEAITLAFIMCGILFRVINNPFFVNALKLLNPGYEAPSREVLSGRLLDIEVAKVINKVDKIIGSATNLTVAAAILNQKILQYQVSGGGLKTYIETRWTTIYECTSSIVRLKACLEDVQENHSEIIKPAILTILRSRGFFSDIQYLSEVLLPIKDAILSVEANRSTLADCYINLMKIATAIQNLPTDEYKGFRNYCIRKFNSRFDEFNDSAYQLAYFLHPAYKGVRLKFGTFPLIANPNPYIASYMIGRDTPLMWWNTCEAKPNCLQHRLEGLAKVYQFNLSNPIDQLRHTQTTEVTSEIMTNIAETVFKEFEEETLTEEEDTELPNPTEDLYSNEPDLNLNVSNFIDLYSSVFTNSESRYENQESNEIESDNNDVQEYNIDEIIA